MRATSFDREAASMLGIDIDHVIVFTFVLGSALAGAAGVMFALRVPTFAAVGFTTGLKGFTAAVIGGIGRSRVRWSAGSCSVAPSRTPPGYVDDGVVGPGRVLRS